MARSVTVVMLAFNYDYHHFCQACSEQFAYVFVEPSQLACMHVTGQQYCYLYSGLPAAGKGPPKPYSVLKMPNAGSQTGCSCYLACNKDSKCKYRNMCLVRCLPACLAWP